MVDKLEICSSIGIGVRCAGGTKSSPAGTCENNSSLYRNSSSCGFWDRYRQDRFCGSPFFSSTRRPARLPKQPAECRAQRLDRQNEASGDASPNVLRDLSLKTGFKWLGTAMKFSEVELFVQRDDTKAKRRHSGAISLAWRLKARFNAAFGFGGFSGASAKDCWSSIERLVISGC